MHAARQGEEFQESEAGRRGLSLGRCGLAWHRIMAARAASLLTALISASLLWSDTAQAQVPDYDSCDTEVADTLWSAEVDTARVRSIYTSPRLDIGRSKTQVIGLQVWVRLADCKGAIVLDFLPSCKLQQVYTRGDCQVPGFSTY